MSATSTDPQGSPLTYSWEFGDGATSAGASVTHTYATEGAFTVRVTATNQLSLSATATETVQVAYLPMTPPSIYSTNEGHFLGQAFTASAGLTEPNGLPVTYEWEFGDGATASTLHAVHTYASIGTYTVKFTARNSVNRSVSATVTVNVFPRTALPARNDNVFSVFCSGAACGAADQSTFTGTGVGIWRYHNATGTAASLDVAIDGVREGHTASLVFINSQPHATATTPGIGAQPLAAMSRTAARKPSGDVDGARAHAQMLENNIAQAREYLRRRSKNAVPLASPLHKGSVAHAAPALGTLREWTEFYSGTSYEMQVGASCELPSGRSAVFWIDAAQVAASKISSARIQYMVDAFCGASGAYARLTGVVGDVWGPAAAGSGFIEDAPGALQDLHVVMPGVTGAGWGGYFSSANLLPRAVSASSNEALVIFLNPSNLIVTAEPDRFTGSTLIHELKHHINFYQRTVARGRTHAPWLEETSAMLAEDFLTPAMFGASRTQARHGGYLFSGGGIGYIGWTHPQGGSYNLGGTFAGFLHRRYGLDIDRKLITDCDDRNALEGYQCVDQVIASLGGVSFADEFERVGASVFGGMARGNVPDGFGFPSIIREGFVLESLDSTPTRRPHLTTPGPLDTGNVATTHTYHLDVIAAGQTVYRRNNVQVPAGATLILVIQ